MTHNHCNTVRFFAQDGWKQNFLTAYPFSYNAKQKTHSLESAYTVTSQFYPSGGTQWILNTAYSLMPGPTETEWNLTLTKT